MLSRRLSCFPSAFSLPGLEKMAFRLSGSYVLEESQASALPTVALTAYAAIGGSHESHSARFQNHSLKAHGTELLVSSLAPRKVRIVTDAN
jgi:hypothetical protein